MYRSKNYWEGTILELQVLQSSLTVDVRNAFSWLVIWQDVYVLFILRNRQYRFARFFFNRIHSYKFKIRVGYELTNEIIFRIL